MLHRNAVMISSAAAVVAILAGAGTASAQLNNRPFSFNNSAGGGMGMSQGGRQAIINEKLFDSTPANILRDPRGELVDVTKGPGKSAIIFRHGTESSMPGFHGTSFRSDDGLMHAGVFNPFFGPFNAGGSFSGYGGNFYTTPMVNSWTMSVMASDTYVPYNAGNSVDAWTSSVNGLYKF